MSAEQTIAEYTLSLSCASTGASVINSSNYLPPSDRFFFKRAIVPCSYYNVSGTYATLTTSASALTVVSGQYTLAALIAQIQTQLQAVDASFTVTQSAITQKITIARSTNFTITASDTSMTKLFGFTTSQTLSGASTYTAANYPDVSIESVRICNSRIAQDIAQQVDENNTPNLVMTIPIDGATGDKIIYEPQYYIPYKMNRAFDLSADYWTAYDSRGSVLDLNGLQIKLTLVFLRE